MQQIQLFMSLPAWKSCEWTAIEAQRMSMAREIAHNDPSVIAHPSVCRPLIFLLLVDHQNVKAFLQNPFAHVAYLIVVYHFHYQ